MVAADATEVHIAGYLRSVVRQMGFPTRESLGHWLASRLLTPDELEEFEREAGGPTDD